MPTSFGRTGRSLSLPGQTPTWTGARHRRWPAITSPRRMRPTASSCALTTTRTATTTLPAEAFPQIEVEQKLEHSYIPSTLISSARVWSKALECAEPAFKPIAPSPASSRPQSSEAAHSYIRDDRCKSYRGGPDGPARAPSRRRQPAAGARTIAEGQCARSDQRRCSRRHLRLYHASGDVAKAQQECDLALALIRKDPQYGPEQIKYLEEFITRLGLQVH